MWFIFASALASTVCPAQISVAYHQPWPPYVLFTNAPTSVQANDEPKVAELHGIDVDLVKAIAPKASQLEFVKMPEHRALTAMENNQLDIIFAASETAERAQYAAFSHPYRQEDVAILTRSQHRQLARVTELAQFYLLAEQQLVGVANRSGYYGADFDHFKQRITPTRMLHITDFNQRVSLVEKQRADYAVVDRGAAQHYISSHPNAGLRLLPFNVHRSPIHLMFSKQRLSSDCIAELNQNIDRVSATAATHSVNKG